MNYYFFNCICNCAQVLQWLIELRRNGQELTPHLTPEICDTECERDEADATCVSVEIVSV